MSPKGTAFDLCEKFTGNGAQSTLDGAHRAIPFEAIIA